MQELITQGRSTDRDYIQGRALLVLVRSLFTKFGWASKEEGSVVTWDVLFDLLVEETTYLPLWVQEMIDNTLVPTFDGDEDAWEVRLAKGLYLLNQTPAVPSTPENLGRLMLDDVTASVDDVVERTESGLETLWTNRRSSPRRTTTATKSTRSSPRNRRASSVARRTRPPRSRRISCRRGWRRGCVRTTRSSGVTAAATRSMSATSASSHCGTSTPSSNRSTERRRPSSTRFAFVCWPMSTRLSRSRSTCGRT
jgi:hypothetical protein